MAADDPDLLPEPPPPRPAGRDAAIAEALRRFDGEPAGAPSRRRSGTGSWTRHPQLGLALAASLVVLIGFPAAFIVLRDQGSSPAEVSVPASQRAVEGAEPPGIAVNEPANAVAAEPPTVPKPVDQLAKVQTAIPPAPTNERQAGTAEANAANDVPAAPPPAMAAPPPPPPPPPPAPPPVAEKSAEGATTNDLVVTGSRIAQPNASPVTALANRERSSAVRGERDAETTAPDWLLKDRGYAMFLTTLQGAVRANDRVAVSRLVQYPLRVNFGGKSRFYRSATAVRADYERIFTPQVRRAILDQRFERLFGNSQGVMIGSGQLWFERLCFDSGCSPPGPILIIAINP